MLHVGVKTSVCGPLKQKLVTLTTASKQTLARGRTFNSSDGGGAQTHFKLFRRYGFSPSTWEPEKGSAHKHRSYIPQALQLPSMRRESSDDGGPHSRLFVLSARPRLFKYVGESPTARLPLPKEILRYVRLSTPMFSLVT